MAPKNDLYEKPSVTVDIAICSILKRGLSILLVERKHPPFRGFWAIPGGFVEIPKKESLYEAACRELKEETGLSGQRIVIEQLRTYGAPERDPRTRVISVVYYSLISGNNGNLRKLKAGSDAKRAEWFPLDNLPDLAFDHRLILKDLQKELQRKVLHSPIAFGLVPEWFTWAELQEVYETILGKKLYPKNFREKMLSQYVFETKKAGGSEEQNLESRRILRKGRPPIFLHFSAERDLEYPRDCSKQDTD